MTEESRRLTSQNADLQQDNDQKVDQANTQDASHHSHAQQSVQGQQRVAVTVQNQLAPPTWSVPAAGRLEGRVSDATAVPIAGCTVEVFFGPIAGMPVAVADTDDWGRFQVEDLPPGFYSLRLLPSAGPATEQWNLRLQAGSVCRVQLCLPPAAMASARRRDRPRQTAGLRMEPTPTAALPESGTDGSEL